MTQATARPLYVPCLLWATIALLPVDSSAQAYPAGPIRLLLPYPPGGASDFVGRTIANRLSEQLRQQVVVDNRGGGGGSIAMEIAAKGTPDGHTLGFAMTAQFAINPALYPKLAYDPVRDFAPISLMTRSPYLLVVHPSVAAKSLADLVALAKSKPGDLNHWSTGNGSAPHLSMEMLKSATGVSIVHVPYKGAGPAWPDFLAGRVHMTFATFSSTSPHIRAGRLRPLGVSSPRRMTVFPELPTIAEQGVAGYESGTWHGLVAPRGTPRAAIERLHAEVVNVLKAPEVVEKFQPVAIEMIGSTPQAFGQYIRSEIAKWAQVVKRSGAKID
jgi:tripartite-type tricarboxylate transporter receptor subunit TctC